MQPKTIYHVINNTITCETNLYEERVVLLTAASFDEAIFKAEKEALSYTEDGSGIYLEYVNVYKLFDDEIRDKTEIFSLMRESNLSPKDYIDQYFDTGKEKTQHS